MCRAGFIDLSACSSESSFLLLLPQPEPTHSKRAQRFLMRKEGRMCMYVCVRLTMEFSSFPDAAAAADASRLLQVDAHGYIHQDRTIQGGWMDG